nr:hypothetical protein [Tanacetum cinerariifolium]
MEDFLTGNYPKDDFTLLETVRRSHCIIRKRIPFELEGETFEPERRVHISRLNPFDCAKLTTFVVMCKAYGFITHIEGWKERFFYVQNSIVPAKYPQLLLEQNKYNSKSYKDKLPPDIEKNPMFQRLGRRTSFMLRIKRICPFLPKEPFTAFDTGSSSVSVNIEPLMTDEEPILNPTKATTDSKGIPKRELFFVHHGSVAAHIKNSKTRRGSSRPPVKRKLPPRSSTSRATRAKTFSSKDDVSFLTISDEDEGLSDVPELKDATAYLHDRCYARQAFIDNVVNKRSLELLGVIEKFRATMSDFEKNPTVVALREKISTLSSKVKEHKANLDRMMLESQKWVGYQANLSSLESQVVSLEAEKVRLEAVEVSLRKEVDDARWDMMEVFSKVVPYAAMELIYSDDLGNLVGKFFSSAIIYGRCKAFEQVAAMNEPFDLTKIPVEVLLLKKPPSIQKPAPSKTQALGSCVALRHPFIVELNNMRLKCGLDVNFSNEGFYLLHYVLKALKEAMGKLT